MAKMSSKQLRIVKSCNLYASSIASGMSMAIIGPTLLELQEIVHTDTEHIAFVYTGRSSGYLLGSLIGGVLFDAVPKKQFLMTIFNLLVAVSLFAVPWSRYLGMITGWMILNGFSMGALDTGLNVCILNLWGKESGPFYQALHFVYGFGSLLSPLIAAPFLRDYHEQAATFINDSVSFQNESYGKLQNLTLEPTFNNSSVSQGHIIPSITYAYSIISCFALLVTVSFLVICIISPLDESGNKAEKPQADQRNLGFVTIVVTLTFLLLFVETGTEIGFAQMVATYAVKGPLKLTPTIGSYITSAFWAAFTLSRFSSIFLVMKFSSLSVIVFDHVLVSAGSVVLLFLAISEEWGLWLASVLLGIGIASLFATAISWVEHYITITNKVIGLFATGAAFGEMVIPYTISYFVETVPEVLGYVVAASCVLSIVLTLILYLILRNKQDKYVKQEGVSNNACDTNNVT